MERVAYFADRIFIILANGEMAAVNELAARPYFNPDLTIDYTRIAMFIPLGNQDKDFAWSKVRSTD